MIHRAPDEFSLSASPTAEVDAQEAFGRVFTGDAAVLRDRAMLLISGLLRNDEGSPVIKGGDNRVTVKVISELSSVRVEIRDSGVGGRAWRAQEAAGPTSREWSPHLLSNVADRWGLVSGAEGAWVWFELDLPEGAGR